MEGRTLRARRRPVSKPYVSDLPTVIRTVCDLIQNLDIQYTVGVATGVPITFISVGENNTDGVSGFIDVFDFLTNEDSPPPVGAFVSFIGCSS